MYFLLNEIFFEGTLNSESYKYKSGNDPEIYKSLIDCIQVKLKDDTTVKCTKTVTLLKIDMLHLSTLKLLVLKHYFRR